MIARGSQGPAVQAHHVRSDANGSSPSMLVATVAIALLIAACARPMQEWDVMSTPAVCDSVASPVKPGERVGAALPSDVRASPDSGTAIGTVTEFGSTRTLQGVSVAFLPLPESDSTRRPRRGAFTSTTGGFEVRSLVPGAYRFRVARIAQLPHERRVDVRAGAIDTFVVQLRPWRCSGY